MNSINGSAYGTVNSDKKRSGTMGPGKMEALPHAMAHMMQMLPRPLLHMRPRRLMKFCPSKMLQLLGVWRLHRGRAPPLVTLGSPRLCQRMQLVALPLLQLLSLIIATALHQLEPTMPLRA